MKIENAKFLQILVENLFQMTCIASVFCIEFRLMSRLDDLRQLEADLVVLTPRACGCTHELISAATGVTQFCLPDVRRCNSACIHRPKDGDDSQMDERSYFRSLVVRAIGLDLLSDEEGDKFCRDSYNIHQHLWGLDDVANAASEGLRDDGELVGITDFSSHWLVKDMKSRQRSHVEDLQYMQDIILARIRSAITGLTHLPQSMGMPPNFTVLSANKTTASLVF